MKTILLHSSFGLWPLLEYELDIAQRELDAGNKVIFLYCDGGQIACPINSPGPSINFRNKYCKECISRVKKGIDWLRVGSGELIVEPYDITYGNKIEEDIKAKLQRIETVYPDQEKIKDIVDIEGVDIFESASSNVMSKLKNSTYQLERNWLSIKAFIEIALRAHSSALYHLDKWLPDVCYIYNGRMSRYRPMLRLIKDRDIKTFVYEYPMMGGIINYESFTLVEDNYSHDLLNFSKQLNKVFIESKLSYQEKLLIGENWHLERLRSSSHDFQVLMRERQKKDTLPFEWNEEEFNISFFVSSEYEWAGIPEVIGTRPYKNQNDCIIALAQILPDHSKLYVRVHPNLKNNEKNMLNIQHKNVVLINPLDSVDTYKLAESSDLVICFGSTVGVEAAFMKRPVIVIGASVYTEFNAAIMVDKHDDFVNVVDSAVNGDYSTFPNEQQRYEGACAYAYSFINFPTKTKYLEKNTYLGGYMVRNGIKTNISANIYIKIYNRLSDFPNKIFDAFKIVINDSSKWNQFKKTPLESIKRKFFGELP
jgi:hypothetical protein